MRWRLLALHVGVDALCEARWLVLIMGQGALIVNCQLRTVEPPDSLVPCITMCSPVMLTSDSGIHD